MNGHGGGGRSKMQLVREALTSFVDSSTLEEHDRVAIVTFDIDGKVIRELEPVGNGHDIRNDISRIDIGEGTTYMLDALITARRMLSTVTGNRQLIVLTDGECFDDRECSTEFSWFVDQSIPIVSIGLGSDWNQRFMTEMSDRTHGPLYHMIDDDDLPAPTSIKLSELASALSKEWNRSRRRTNSDVQIDIKVPKDVKINHIHKVFPTVAELPIDDVVRCGNLASGESVVVLVDIDCPPREFGDFRMMRVRPSTATDTGERLLGDPTDVVVNITDDSSQVFTIDPEVQNWMQQRNIAGLLTRASDNSVSVDDRRSALIQAQGMASRVANVDLGKTIMVALGDLDTSKTVRVDVAKALHVAGKTHTLDFARSGLITPELEVLIRQVTDLPLVHGTESQ
jgi:Ca-activated chloride channel homolog